jgi:hypothetical protein
VPEPFERARDLGAVDGRSELLRSEQFARFEGAPLAVVPAREVGDDDLGVELRVERSARLVPERRRDQARRRLALARGVGLPLTLTRLDVH